LTKHLLCLFLLALATGSASNAPQFESKPDAQPAGEIEAAFSRALQDYMRTRSFIPFWGGTVNDYIVVLPVSADGLLQQGLHALPMLESRAKSSGMEESLFAQACAAVIRAGTARRGKPFKDQRSGIEMVSHNIGD